MSIRSLLIAAGFAAAMAIPAAAEAAYTTGSVNVRTGPGTYYPVVVTAAPGAWISVHDCVPAWCRITYEGITGWMSSSFIAQGGPRYYQPRPYVYAPPPPPVYYPQPYVYQKPYPAPYVYKPYRPYKPRPYVYFGYGR